MDNGWVVCTSDNHHTIIMAATAHFFLVVVSGANVMAEIDGRKLRRQSICGGKSMTVCA